MQFTFALTLLFITFVGLAQALPVSRRTSGALWGVTYTARSSDGTCHTAQQVSEYIQRFKSNGIKHVRTYSQECNQLQNIANAIEAAGGDMTILAAVWIDGSAGDDTEINELVSNLAAINKNLVYGITVGNENVLSGRTSSAYLIQKINQVKSKVKGIRVGTVETPGSFPDELIAASDIIGVNIHPFFGAVSASEAVENLQQQYNNFVTRTGDKEVLVGEVGWPTAGESNGNAKPSVTNLAMVVTNIVKTKIKYYFFESHDSKWKGAGAFDVEPHWGLFDANGKSKIPQLH